MRDQSIYPISPPAANSQAVRFAFKSVRALDKREINKIIDFDYLFDEEGRPVYNLGFGDEDPSSHEVDDKAISNNGDMLKVFATVLASVPLFFNLYPNALLFVTGSDDRRKRIYGRFVNQYWAEIKRTYQVYGSPDRTSLTFETFVQWKAYEAFLICLK